MLTCTIVPFIDKKFNNSFDSECTGGQEEHRVSKCQGCASAPNCVDLVPSLEICMSKIEEKNVFLLFLPVFATSNKMDAIFSLFISSSFLLGRS